jgi:4-hydroxy-4-methyl-2-oxoglutarate aldolase
MNVFANDRQMFDTMTARLYTGVVCDVMDEMGYRNQAMRQDIRPLERDYVVAGRAKTILAVDIYEVLPDPYRGEIEAVDSLQPDEVVVLATNRSQLNGIWGELMSTASKGRGARGAIIDGITRDTKKILELGFPVFTVALKPLDSRGRGMVLKYDCPILCGDIMVYPGDVIFGDLDGVVVIPAKIAEEVCRQALEKVEKEDRSREELIHGAYLKDVYNKYKVL